MQEALRDDFGWDTAAEATHSPSRRNKFLVAGAAVVGAGAMAVTPVQVMPTLPDIQVRAVELSAVVDPITQFEQSIAATLTNLNLLGTNLSTVTVPALGNILQGSPALAQEFLETIASGAVNPFGTLAALQGVFDTYGPIIESGSAASNTALLTALENLPTIIENTLGYLQTGQFVEAFSEVNIWFLVQLLERPFVPLLPTLGLPADLADALGADTAGNVLDALFTRGGINGITKAALSPIITATLQGAVILDEVRAAYEAGDTATALTGLASLPGYVTNAFFNGFVPPFPSRSTFPGVFSDGGPIDYFAVDLPRIIGNALKPATAPALLRTEDPALKKVTSPEVAPADDTVTLDIPAKADAPVITPEVTDTTTDEILPVVEETPVVDEEADEKVTTRPNTFKAFNDGVAKAVNDTRLTLKKAFSGGQSPKKETPSESDSKPESPKADADKGDSDKGDSGSKAGAGSASASE
ncbi:hypothetical protein [Mycolicibacterium baixiangningiae]|uniref:hypothetical protein n=1 Tax=Mycolicibacterium baixiangningiae TaxID=2761578 RepID=UPI001D02C66A|nr:hypothetical protein [Mycolicibacterium baixiangningiae]